MPDPVSQSVTMVDPSTGRAADVPLDLVNAYRDQGFTFETPDQRSARLSAEVDERLYGGPAGAAAAGAASVARGATLGLSDVAARALGGEDAAIALQGYREAHPYVSTGGEIAGAILPTVLSGGAAAPAGLAGRAGAAIAERAGGGILARAAGGAVEGALFGAGQGVSELALSRDPLTLEHAAASIGSNALYGAGVGGAAGGALKGVEVGLSKARRAVESFADRQAAAQELVRTGGAVDADLAGMDAKALKATRDAELDRLSSEQATQRAAARSSAVDDVLAYRGAVDEANPWLVINEGQDAARLGKTTKAFRNILDDAEGLRENPAALGKPLRIEAKALQNAIGKRAEIAAKLDAENQKIAADLEKTAPQPVSEPGPVAIRKVGRREMEATLPDGTTRKLDMSERAQDDFLAEQMPEGFKPGGVAVSTSRDFSIERGVPAAPGAIKENALYVTRPSQLAEHRLIGDRLETADRTAKQYVDDIENLWKEGKKLEPITAYVKPDRTIYIEDGNHRLQAAARTDREIAVHFKDGARYQPKANAADITERVKAELSSARPSPQPASVELTGKAARRYATFAGIKLPKGRKITVTGDEAQAFLDALKGGQIASDSRKALDSLDGLLEQNRALQERIRAATAPLKLRSELTSEKLTAIENAQEILRQPKPVTEPLPGTKLLGHVGYGAAAGLVSGIPVIGHILGPLAGSAVANAVGSLGKAASAGGERVARAAAGFLGKASAATGKAAKLAPRTATAILGALRYGEPETDDRGKRVPRIEPKSLPELYRARTGEIRSQVQLAPDGTYQMRPAARQKMAARLAGLGMADPIAADHMESSGAARLTWLASQMPRRPELAGLPIGPDTWSPSDLEIRSWAIKAAAAEDPISVLERASAGKNARVVPEEAMALQALYPELLNDYITRIVTGIASRQQRLPYAQRLALSMLTGRPLDPAMTPSVLRQLQSMYITEPGTAGGTMAPRAQPQFGSVRRSDPGTPAQRRQGLAQL